MDCLSIFPNPRPFTLPYYDTLVDPPKSLASTSFRPLNLLHRRVESASGARAMLTAGTPLDPTTLPDREAVLELSSWVGRQYPVDITMRNEYRRKRVPQVNRLRPHSITTVSARAVDRQERGMQSDYAQWTERVRAEEAKLKAQIVTVEKRILTQQGKTEETEATLAALTSAYSTAQLAFTSQAQSLKDELERIVITKDTVQTDPQAFLRKAWIKEELGELKAAYEIESTRQREVIDQASARYSGSQSDLEALRSTLDTDKSQLLHFYYKALKEGKACRSDGIRWAVKAIWAQGEAVPVSAFPAFLDKESVQHLLDQADREVELAGFKARYKDLREVLPARPQVRLNDVLHIQIFSRLKQASNTERKRAQRISYDLGTKAVTVTFQDQHPVQTLEAATDYREIGWVKENMARLEGTLREAGERELGRVKELWNRRPWNRETDLPTILRTLEGNPIPQ